MKPLYIIVHHTVSSRDKTTVADVDAWHKLRWPDFRSELGYWVGYHYLIEGNGQITQTRKGHEEGAHTLGGYNQKSIGVCLTGDFDTEEPSVSQLAALKALLDRLKRQYDIPDTNILGHKQAWLTACPGFYLMKWLDAYKQLSLLQRLFELLNQLQLLIKRSIILTKKWSK